MPNRIVPPNKVLMEMYYRPMSAGEISKELGINLNTVSSALVKIPGITMRNNSQAQKLAFLRGKKPVAYWRGKKQPAEMVKKRIDQIRGEKHWLWKGGKDIREYRKKIVKITCNKCGSKLNLGIHHKDFDHYNNNETNLQVLCVHCHLSLHKTEYWDAVRNGRKPKKSTAPCRWKKQ